MFNTKHFRTLLLILSASLAACSSGGGGGTPPIPVTPTSIPTSTPAPVKTATPTATPVGASPTPKATATPTVSPTATPTPVSASASGTVVDFASNIGLAGVSVAIAPYTHGAPSNIVATTNANGAFSFTAAPGTYLIFIGSNSPTDTRTTYHNEITLVAGDNALTQGVPSPEPQVTLTAAQQSGNFRLATLTTIEESCVTAMNSGRSNANLGTLIPDENALEYERALDSEQIAQSTDTPTPLFNGYYFYNAIGFNGGAAGMGFASCPSYTNSYTFTSESAPYAEATDPTQIWYGAEWSGTSNGYTGQIFLRDPR